MIAVPDRILPFERCFNFRDIGGYSGRDGRTVKWRRMFRSMTPQYMTGADAEAVGGLGISLVIDFRGDQYPSSGPLPVEGGTRVALGPAAVQRTDAEYEEFRAAPPHEALPRVLETYAAQFAAAVSAMAEQPEATVLFHCRLGKDRTGVFTALLLKLLGVGDDDVVRDYMITEQQEPFSRRLLNEYETEDIASKEPAVAREPASRAAIEGVLQRLASQYGGAYAYFIHHGVPADRLNTFVENALEPPGPGPSTNGRTAWDQSIPA